MRAPPRLPSRLMSALRGLFEPQRELIGLAANRRIENGDRARVVRVGEEGAFRLQRKARGLRHVDDDRAILDRVGRLQLLRLDARIAMQRARLAAENAWRAFAEEQGPRLVIFRLPGIYGPGRSAIDQVRSGRAQRIFKAGQVFSRMHVEDIAAAVEASLNRPQAGALFNLADDEPAPPQDVVDYACRLLGVPSPPLIPIEEAALSDMARSFYADNKRVSNALMKRALGVGLLYPTYREGLRAILDSEIRRA